MTEGADGSDHVPEPVWDKPTNGRRMICYRCKREITGGGTKRHPWRHKA